MTLFEQWCTANNKAPLPAYLRKQENPYLACLKLAEIQEDTFYQRQERRVLSWYDAHPACKQMLLPMDWRDESLRSKEPIDIQERFGRGWFDRVTAAKHHADGERPEHRPAEIETFDKALAIADYMNSDAYRREIETEFIRKKGRRKALKASNYQLELDLRI